jgi:hypothetical protein
MRGPRRRVARTDHYGLDSAVAKPPRTASWTLTVVARRVQSEPATGVVTKEAATEGVLLLLLRVKGCFLIVQFLD